jgi:hypothetical protein
VSRPEQRPGQTAGAVRFPLVSGCLEHLDGATVVERLGPRGSGLFPGGVHERPGQAAGALRFVPPGRRRPL